MIDPWIQVYGGGQFHVLNPRADEFNVEAVAHALANTNRYNGSCNKPLSVAEHSVMVSIRAEALAAGKSPEQVKTIAQWGLIHDWSEAYIGDLNHPTKSSGTVKGYLELEADLMAWACKRLGLPLEMPVEVKQADEQVYMAEVEQLMTPVHPEWKAQFGDKWRPAPVKANSLGIGWREARTLFLNRFFFLFGHVK